MNKQVNGSQLTVVWHVDDLKISQKDQSVVEDFIKELNGVYGKERELTANIGNVHHYLGMTFDYSRSGCVTITMFDYIQQILNELDPTDQDFQGTALTPATANIFCNNNIMTFVIRIPFSLCTTRITIPIKI